MAGRKTDKEIMSRDHWAIISTKTTFHEGDERSRTHPGHGYPAHTTTDLVYEPFETEEELMAEIERRRDRGSFQVIKALTMRVETETIVVLQST